MEPALETDKPTPAPTFPQKLLESALGFYKTQQSYESEVNSFLSQCPALPEGEFWEAVGDLRKTAESLTRSIGEEFVRLCWVNQTCIPIERVGSFASAYRNACSKIAAALDRVDTGRTEDPHGDLIDALPLLGKKAYDEILNVSSDREFKGFETRWKEKAGNHLGKRIFGGENYIATGLANGLQRFLPSYARENDSDRK